MMTIDLNNLLMPLVAKTNSEDRNKQKILARTIEELFKNFETNPVENEIKNCLTTIIKLHKESDLSGNILVNNLKFDSFPNYKDVIDNYIKNSVTSEELNEYINLVEAKIKSKKTDSNIEELLKDISKIQSASSISDAEKLFKDTISKVYLNFMREKIEDTTELILTSDNLNEKVVELKKSSLKKLYVPSGFNMFDNTYLKGGFESGRLYMFGGKPGSGKSAVLLNLFLNSAKKIANITKNNKDNAVVYITLENDISETFDRYFSCILRQSVKSKDLTSDYITFIYDYLKQNHSNYNFVIKYMEAYNTTTLDIMKYIDSLQEKYNIQAIFVDYLDLMRSSQQLTERRFDLGLSTTELKIIGKKTGCPMIVATQINTAGYDGIPSMANLDESRQKGHNADSVILMFDIPFDCLSEEDKGEREPDKYELKGFNIDKNRDGKKGVIALGYYSNLFLFESLPKGKVDKIINNFLINKQTYYKQ